MYMSNLARCATYSLKEFQNPLAPGPLLGIEKM